MPERFPMGRRVTVTAVSVWNAGLAIGERGVVIELRPGYPNTRRIRTASGDWIVNVKTLVEDEVT